MAILSLVRAAFVTSREFNDQVNGVAVQQALYRADALTPDDPNLAAERARLAAVVANPAGYAFVSAVVSDAAWALGYDAWAADPAAADGAILAAVNKVWPLLVG
jgi:hypothetical protein